MGLFIPAIIIHHRVVGVSPHTDMSQVASACPWGSMIRFLEAVMRGRYFRVGPPERRCPDD
jgi:hypothetical protein